MCSLPIAWKSFGCIIDLSMILQSQANAKGSHKISRPHVSMPFLRWLWLFLQAQKEGAPLDNIYPTRGKQTKCANLKPFFVLLLVTCKAATKFLIFG
jgi:hypothetical protein